jgi:uncharacterized membrane protein
VDMAPLILLALAAIVLIPLGAILGIVAFQRTGRLAAELATLRRELSGLRAAIAVPSVTAPVVSRIPPVETPPDPAAASPEEPPPTVAAEPMATEPVAAAPAEASAELELVAVVRASATDSGPTKLGLERNLTGRWTIWLGAVTLALSGVFLVKYSIEQDLLGPGVRIAFGILFGAAFIAASLRLRSVMPERAAKLAQADHIPAALAAAGIADLFATIYAAFALYDFLGPLTAFVLLAGIAAIGVGLSLLYGPFIALLGLAGAFLVPLLVPSDHPSAFGLFGYLLVVAVGSLAVLRYKGWWWLAYVALAGSSLWTIVWLAASWEVSDATVVGLYLVLATAAFFHFARDAAGSGSDLDAWRSSRGLFIWAAAVAKSLLVLLLAVIAADSTPSLLAVAALMILLLAAGWRHAAFDGFAFLAGVLGVAVIAAWELGSASLDATGQIAVAPHEIVPVFAGAFVTAAVCFAALLGGAGFLALWSAARPGRWAAISAAAPILILAAVYWRLGEFAVSLPWTLVGLALAAVDLAAASRVARQREMPGMEAALAAYAVGVIAATGFAATMSLRHAWLSVALSVALPGIAWVARETRVAALRPVSLVVAAIVLARLLLNPGILDYPADGGVFLNWLLYGYGIPSVAFLTAAIAFRRGGDDVLVMVLEAGSIALAIALVSLELHQLFGNGALDNPHYDFAEAAFQVDAWGAGALALLYRAGRRQRPVLVWALRIVAAVAALHLVFVQMLALNPLLTRELVGNARLFNLLLPAYAVPAILAALIRREAERQGEGLAAMVAGGFALALGFVALSLELRQWFHGTVLLGPTSDAEAYAYSVVWLLYGGALLGAGIWRARPTLRLAAIGLLTLTVAKAFLFDMSNLTGLYRAASFLGLGLCLVGIGYLYQRVVFPAPAAGRAPDAS